MAYKLFVSIKSVDNQQKIEIDYDIPNWEYQIVHTLGEVTANNVVYEAFVCSSRKIDRRSAQIAFVSILDNLVVRKRTVGRYVKLPHDAFWNSIFIIDNQQDKNRGTLNLRYVNERLQLHTTDEGKPHFVPFERDFFSLEDIMSVYEEAGYIFSEMPSTDQERSKAFIGILITIDIDAMVLGNTVSEYLLNLSNK